jgi:hypothetical protein
MNKKIDPVIHGDYIVTATQWNEIKKRGAIMSQIVNNLEAEKEDNYTDFQQIEIHKG